jgi:O-antigen/teichoic acid export membrane protein
MLPALLVQSLWRFACFTLARPETAVVNDIVWVTVQMVALVIVIKGGWNTPTTVVLAWSAGAVAAALVGCRQLRVLPDPAAGLGWLRDTAELGVRYAAEFVGTFGASQAALSVTGGIAGLGAVSQLRGAQVAYGPLLTLSNGIRVAGTPIAVRERAKGGNRLRRVTTVVGGGMAFLVLVWTVLLLVMPDSVGEAVLGDSWDLARQVIPAVAVNNLATAWAAGLLVTLRALADARRSLRGRLATGGLRLVGAAIGAAVAGGPGAAWGLAIGAVIGLGVLQLQYWEALRAQVPSR